VSAHTEGRLVVGEAREFSCDLIADGRSIAKISYRIQQDAVAKADARRLAACWNAAIGLDTEAIESGPDAYGKELAAARTRADWLQRMHTLHRAVEMLYVVDGYHVTLTWDGTPISSDYHGETLDAAIDKAMLEFDAEARPKWIGRKGEPALIEDQLATATALIADLKSELVQSMGETAELIAARALLAEVADLGHDAVETSHGVGHPLQELKMKPHEAIGWGLSQSTADELVEKGGAK